MNITSYILYKPLIDNFKNNFNENIELKQVMCGNEWNWDSESELEIEKQRQSINNVKICCCGLNDDNFNDGDW
jgi:hypothetical protein